MVATNARVEEIESEANKLAPRTPRQPRSLVRLKQYRAKILAPWHSDEVTGILIHAHEPKDFVLMAFAQLQTSASVVALAIKFNIVYKYELQALEERSRHGLTEIRRQLPPGRTRMSQPPSRDGGWNLGCRTWMLMSECGVSSGPPQKSCMPCRSPSYKCSLASFLR